MGKKLIFIVFVLILFVSPTLIFTQKTSFLKTNSLKKNGKPGISKISAGDVIVPGTHGSLAAWGWNFKGECNVPAGNDFIAVAAGHDHSLAVRSNGTLDAWGWNFYGQCDVPAGNDFIAVAGGAYHSLALRSGGSLTAWGRNDHGQCNVPAGNDFIAVAGIFWHNLALRLDGSLTAWGRNDHGQCNVPASNDFIAVAAGNAHSLALRSDGSLTAWGRNDEDQCNVPAGNDFIAVAAGSAHSLALRTDGSLAAWGSNGYDQCIVPPGNNYIAVAGGAYHSLAERSDGSLVAWGRNDFDQLNVPAGNDFIALTGGYYHNLAIRQICIIDAAVAGGNGVVNPETQNLSPGEDAVINLGPVSGYTIASIVDNGIAVAVTNPYVIYNVTIDHDVVVTFEASQYEVQALVFGGNGTVNPAIQTMNHGSNTSINITPDANYDISIISDNGQTMPITNPYMITNVTEDHYVTLSFVDNSLPSYTVTASVVGDHGTVLPATQILNQGRSTTILLQPHAGYHVQSISDNGVSMPIANPYFIHNLNSNHNVLVSFANAPPQVQILSPADGSPVSGICEVQAKATDDTGIQKLDIYVDGVRLHTASANTSTYPWDTNSVSLGVHSIRAVAYDHAGAQGEHAITVFVQSLILGINAQRGSEGAWLIRKDYVRIQLSVINEAKIPVAKYIVYRKEEGGNYHVVQRVAGSQLPGGTYTFNDAPLDKGKRYTYKFEAKDANGLSIAYSGEITI